MMGILTKNINGRPLFDPNFLGDKAELTDCIVNLIDDKASVSGAYFLVQVKASKRANSRSIPATFTAREVQRAIERKVPVYLVAVDSTADREDEVYILAIDSQTQFGVRSIPKTFKLNSVENLQALYDEVNQNYGTTPYMFKSKFS